MAAQCLGRLNEESWADAAVSQGANVPWTQLTQPFKRAAMTLGYTQPIWDEIDVSDMTWRYMSPAQRAAAGVLGFTQKSWDDEEYVPALTSKPERCR